MEDEECNFQSVVTHVKNRQYHHLLSQLRHGLFKQTELNKALQVSTSSGDLQCTKILLSFGADVTYLDECNYNCPLLLCVVLRGHCEILKVLLEFGYNINYKIDHERETNYSVPLNIAIWKNNFLMVEYLLSAKCNTEYKDAEGNTALLVSCICGYEDILYLLLEQKCDMSAQNYNGQSCLHLAVKHGHTNIVVALLECNVNINAEDETGDTPLMVAAKSKLENIFKMLLPSPGVDINHKNKDGCTIVHILGSYAKPNLMEYCSKYGCNLYATDNYNNTILNIASCFKNEELIYFLMTELHLKVLSQKGFMGRTFLHLIVINGMKDLLEYALTLANMDLDIQDEGGNTPLILSVKADFCVTSDVLLGAGANPNISDVNHWTPLHWACQKGNLNQINILLKYGSDIFHKTKDYETCLHIAVKQNHMDIVNKLLQLSGCEKLIDHCDKLGKTLLHYAIDNGQSNFVYLLLEKAGSRLINIVDNDCNSAITLSTASGQTGIIQSLINFGAELNILDGSGKSPLMNVIIKNDVETTKMLLEYGSDPNLDTLSTCLIQASRHGNLYIVELLLGHGSHVDQIDKYGRTAFIWAAQNGHLNVMKLLYEHGSNSKAVDESGDTALTVSAFAGQTEAVEFLIPISDINHRENEDGMSALLLALSNGHRKCANLLLAAGADVNITGENGNNALITAVATNLGKDIVNQILQTGRINDINKLGDQRRSIIHWAVSDIEILTILLESNGNIKINEIDENGASPLLLAIAHSFTKSALALLNANCCYDVIHIDGRQPIHHASIYGETDVLKSLLEKGASPYSLTADKRTPLLLACIEGHTKCVEILLQSGATDMVNEIYFEAITALSVAVNGSYYDTMNILLLHGAQPDLIGPKKYRPLIGSILRDDYKSVKMLLQWGADIENVIDINNHALTVASIKQRWNILILLLEVLTDTNIVRRILKGGAIYYFVLDERVRKQLKYFVVEPPSLMKICRGALRKCIHFPVKINLQQLSIGSTLVNFVLFNES